MGSPLSRMLLSSQSTNSLVWIPQPAPALHGPFREPVYFLLLDEGSMGSPPCGILAETQQRGHNVVPLNRPSVAAVKAVS